jgi:peptide deformylase
MVEFEQQEVDLTDYKSQLVHWNDPILKTATQFYDCVNPPIDPIELYNKLCTELNYSQGIGITANQIGIPYSVVLLRDGTIMFNPRIVMNSQEDIELEEGCLSFPGLVLPISRSRHCKVRYQEMFIPGQLKNNTDNTVTKQFTGMTARCILHEMHHIKGQPFFYNISRLKIERAINKCKKEYGIDFTGILGLVGSSIIMS